MLNPKQERFCREYVIDLNGAQAAIRAGYSEKTAKEQAAQLLTILNVQSFIKKLQKEISERTGVTADRIVKELEKIGFSNPQDFIGSGNSINDLSAIKKEKAAAVSSIKKTVFTDKNGNETETTEFKLWDKVKSLELLGKHVGLFELDNKQKSDKIKVTVKSNAGS